MNDLSQAKASRVTAVAARGPLTALSELLRTRDMESKVVIFAAYFLAAYSSFEAQQTSGAVLAFWAPAGIAMAAFLMKGCGIWYLISAAAFAVDLLTTGSAVGALLMATGQTVGPLAGALVLERAKRSELFFSPESTCKFVFLSAPILATVSASIGAAACCLVEFGSKAGFVPLWLNWWRGDFVGAIAVTPLIVLVVAHYDHAIHTSKSVGLLGLTLTLIFTCIVIFCPTKLVREGHGSIQFLTLPLLALFVVRYCPLETAIANFVIAGFTSWSSIHGQGPFSYASAPEFLSGIYVAVISATALYLSAAYASARRNQEAELFSRLLELARSKSEIADLKLQLQCDQRRTTLGPASQRPKTNLEVSP